MEMSKITTTLHRREFSGWGGHCDSHRCVSCRRSPDEEGRLLLSILRSRPPTKYSDALFVYECWVVQWNIVQRRPLEMGLGGRELLVMAFIPFVNWKGNYKLQCFTVHYYHLPTEWLFICVFWALSHSLFKIILLLFSHSPFGWNKNYSAAHQTFAGLSQITFMVIGWCEKKYLPAVGAFINVCRKPL